MEGETHTLMVAAGEGGARLDRYLSARLEGVSRARIQKLIAEGCVSADGVPVTDSSLKIKENQQVDVFIPPVKETHLAGEDIPLGIVHEDADILILNKPPNLTVHPAPGHARGTLVNALIHHCGASLSGIGGVARPGIVHRLDKDTSGLMAVAKNDAAHAALSRQLAERSLKRQYWAIVWGVPQPPKGTITGNIGRSPKNRQKMTLLKTGGKEAVTHYSVKEIFQAKGKLLAALVECRLETGRTHQIRVHLSHRGHPLIGDPLYGRTPIAFHRQALHAYRLGLIHPRTGERMQFEAQMPEDMQALLSALKEMC